MKFSTASRGMVFGVLMVFWQWSAAFQIGPLGTSHEERLTNESNSTLADIAQRLGVLIKAPVHEEITHLGKWCHVERTQLATDTYCSGRDVGFASPYVIYGVRWNDLPPFRLEEGQGNLMTRSHFGDLQFLHGMANAPDLHPVDTRAQILDWLEFAWKVSSKEIRPQTQLKTIDNPTIQRHFGCTEWTVADLYLLGRQDANSGLMTQIREIAFGSVLHTVQDSFAAAHAEREPQSRGGQCEGTSFMTPARIVEFHAYGAQDGSLHDHDDSREAMTAGAQDRWPEAVEVTRNLFDLQADGAKWADASAYLQCVFTLSDDRRVSSPGDAYRRTAVPLQP